MKIKVTVLNCDGDDVTRDCFSEVNADYEMILDSSQSFALNDELEVGDIIQIQILES